MTRLLEAAGYEVLLDKVPRISAALGDGPREYFFGEDPYHATSIHRVRVLKAGEDVSSCILAATGGATGIHEHSALTRNDECLVAVGPFFCSLRLPGLELIWSLQVDQITCFGVYHSERHHCYIVHGELDISRVSYDGKRVWSAGGKDIFTGEFTVLDDHSRVVDFNGETYDVALSTGRIRIVEP